MSNEPTSWERQVQKYLWLKLQDEWKENFEDKPSINEQEGWENAPVTRWCRGCQREHPIEDFRWVPPEWAQEDDGMSGAVMGSLTTQARKLDLIEGDEYVHVLYYLSNDEGQSIHKRLGGTPRRASHKLNQIAKGKG